MDIGCDISLTDQYMFHSIFKRLFAEIIERTKCPIQHFRTNQTFSGLVLFVFTLC